MTEKIKTTLFRLSWVAGAIAILLFYFLFDPMEKAWMPQCLFHKITGLQCMGCGSQRMAHALLHGDFARAWNANAFIMLLLPVVAFLIFVEMTRLKFPRLYARVHRLWVIITISAMLVAWLIVRNIFGM